MRAAPAAELSSSRDPGVGGHLASWLLPAGLVYFTLVGGTAPGELVPVLRLMNSAVGLGLILLWLRLAPRQADALDLFALGGLLLFLVSGVSARAPHAAFEAAVTSTSYLALLFLARRALADPATRTRTAVWLGLTGVVLAAVYTALWLAVWARWLGAGQPASALFDLPLPAGPYAFKHNVALTAGLLVPFLWVAPSSRPSLVLRGFGAMLLVPVLVIAGSRGLWIGALLGSAVVAMLWIARRRRTIRSDRRWWLLAPVGLLAVGAVFLLAPDLTHAIWGRLGDMLTVNARWVLWRESLTEWHTSLLTGVGPGGWPIWLPTTGYFDLPSFSPRHPDSFVFQLLAEIGVLGVAAVLLVAAGVLRAVRTPPRAAIWAACFPLVVLLTANPTDLPFAVVLGIAWLAVAAPRVAGTHPFPARRMLPRARYVLLVVVAIAVGASSAAAMFHDRARSAAGAGDLLAARGALQAAVRLDPGMALYHRELGAVLLASGEQQGALNALLVAARLAPADDIAQAGLAVAWSLTGHDAAALAAAARAIELRRSAPVNHLVAAWVAIRGGRAGASAAALADALVLAPWLSGADGWPALRGGNQQRQIVGAAARQAKTDLIGFPEGDAAWLAGMSGSNEAGDTVNPRGGGIHESLRAVMAMLRCEAPRAVQIIADASERERATFGYWMIRAMIERAAGSPTAYAERIAGLLGNAAILTVGVSTSVSAFAPRADDQWVYDRLPLGIPAAGPAFPSADNGLSRWITDPRRTARTAAPASGLAKCGG